MDTSVKPYGGNIRDAELRLLDGDGKLLVSARTETKTLEWFGSFSQCRGLLRGGAV
jgi:hypothetical protein